MPAFLWSFGGRSALGAGILHRALVLADYRLPGAHASGTALLHKPVVHQELQAAIDTVAARLGHAGEATPTVRRRPR
ncbi:hypothetical protein AU476_08275 [Cupriavidus sp. UYMSc13B]|nr:hypothetical protein AU476_08275 [Cupriavidus sp. UYMSc13B]